MNFKYKLKTYSKYLLLLFLLLNLSSCVDYVEKYAGENAESGIIVEYDIHYKSSPNNWPQTDHVNKTEVRLIYPDETIQVIETVYEKYEYSFSVKLNQEQINLVKSRLPNPSELSDDSRLFFRNTYVKNSEDQEVKALRLCIKTQNHYDWFCTEDEDEPVDEYMEEDNIAVLGLAPMILKFVKRENK